jgi:hypothetical protein
MGYRLNQNVYVPSTGKDGKITKIINFAFWKSYSDWVGSSGIRYCFTLLYEIEGHDEYYYQITQIEKSDRKGDDIVDNIIDDNFLELTDEGIVEFVSTKASRKGSDARICRLIIKSNIDPETLHRVYECLLVAKKRLNDDGFSLEVKDINKKEIEFIVYKTQGQ